MGMLGNLDLTGPINAHGHRVRPLVAGAVIDDPDLTPVLRVGAHGVAVMTLQRMLNAWDPSLQLPINGNFRERTEAAVIHFQETRIPPLTNDGIVDASTWAALRAARAHPPVGAQPPVVAPPPVGAQPPPVGAQPPPVVAQPPPDVVQPPPDVVQPPPDVVQPPPDVVQPPPDVVQPPVVGQQPRVVAQPPVVRHPPVVAQPPTPLLQLGMHDPAVVEVQNLLNAHGSATPPLPATDFFGPRTVAALRIFQGTRSPPLPVTGTTDPATWAALRAAPAPGEAAVAAVPQIPPAIAVLDLAPNARNAALVLLQQAPGVRFTSGRRDIHGQAHAMATNIVSGGGRNWIANTYRAGPADRLQAWVTQNPNARTVHDITAGLEGVMTQMQTEGAHVLGRVSRHLTGEAFDVQPGSCDVALLSTLPGQTQVLTREGGVVLWHVTVPE
jgi:peptidoglycan hydrolase-like protein with peptidoglycan-binding domain